MKRFFTTFLLFTLTVSTGIINAQCSDLFISEYIEGSSSNKAVEIYNPTGNPVTLSNYAIYRNNNGSQTPSDSIVPQGTLAPGDVFIIANSSANSTILGLADTTHSLTWYNGDDAVWMKNLVTGDTLDIIGIIGQDPGTNWPVGITGATSEFTLVRKSTIQSGQTNWAFGAAEWEVYPQNFTDSLGAHHMQPCSPSGGPCSELFISEYIEGSSSNKAVEIYNPTNNVITLSNYAIFRNNNGSQTPSDSIVPQGTIAPGGVFIIANSSANSTILGLADTTHSLTWYNGDDAVWMKNLVTGDTLDIIGIIGQDPGSNWTVGSGATSEYTLVRKSSVQQGQTNWAIGATEWDVYPQNFADSLGSHSMVSCGSPVIPEVSFAAVSLAIDEDVGNANVNIAISNFNSDTTTVEIALIGGTATQGSDFTFSSPQIAVFPGGSGLPANISIPIIDDATQEPAETILLILQNATNGATIGTNDTLEITINANDKPIPVYTISQVHGEDASGVADSLNVVCELRGVVLGTNLRPSGLQFQMHDGTGGINVFNFSVNYGYTVNETDSIHVVGTIAQYRGLTEIIPDTVIYISTGHDLPKPYVVSQLDESTEGELVKIVGFYMIDTNQWTGSGSGFNVDITNGMDTLMMRIDNDNNLYGDPNPGTGLLNITGVGSQYNPSSSAPYLDGYQLFPRYREDIEATQAPLAGFVADVTGLSIDFTDTSTNCPIYWAWDFGDGNTDSINQHPSHTFATAGYYYVCLTAGNPAGSSTVCDSIYVEAVGIDDPAVLESISAYPIPVADYLTIQTDLTVSGIEVYNSLGQLIDLPMKSGTTSIDFRREAPGFYLVRVYTEDAVSVIRILKE